MNEVVGILADALKGTAHAELQRAFLVFLLQGLLPWPDCPGSNFRR